MFRGRLTLSYYRRGRAREVWREGETQRCGRERRRIEGEAEYARVCFAIRREQLSRLLQNADGPRGERRQLIALAHGLCERAEQMADAVRIVAHERAVSRHH
jgi:hypothetical protein